jgi:hypothetical protein
MFQRKARSAYETELLRKVKEYLPTGVRGSTLSPEHAMVIALGRGSRIRDLSGNEHVLLVPPGGADRPRRVAAGKAERVVAASGVRPGRNGKG